MVFDSPLPHVVYRYTDGIYKVVQFKSMMIPLRPGDREDPQKFEHYDDKLAQSVSRSRRNILEMALCNPWEYFCTFTIDPARWDRNNLPAWRKAFTQWLRDLRKRGSDIHYLLIPEMHEDGCWHMHGLLSGIDRCTTIPFRCLARRGVPLPDRLRNSDYLDWIPYAKKFGHCSLGPIKNHFAVSLYVTKYLTKDLGRYVSVLGANLYYCSQGLNRPEKVASFFDRDPALDRLLRNEYEFCSTGFVFPSSDSDFFSRLHTFCDLELYSDGHLMVSVYYDGPPPDLVAAEAEADAFGSFMQIDFDGKEVPYG